MYVIMRIKSMVLSGVLLCNASIVFSGDIGSAEKSKGMFSHLALGLVGSYTDFNFNSTSGRNFNRFQGHSKLYSIGAGNVLLSPEWTAGVALFRVDTSVRSQNFLSPGVPSNAKMTSRSNLLFGHLLKQIKPHVYLDLAGAYGQNKLNTQTQILTGGVLVSRRSPRVTPSSLAGVSSSNTSNWFTSLTALYSKPWNKFLVNANGRLLYSRVNAGSYLFTYQSALPSQTVQAITNKAVYLMENVELGYKLDQKRLPLTPFVNAGLVQVLHFSNSRPLVNAARIVGVVPQLSLDKNGYRLGGGATFQHKNLSIRLEEQYYRASSTYSSYQTIAALKYMIS